MINYLPILPGLMIGLVFAFMFFAIAKRKRKEQPAQIDVNDGYELIRRRIEHRYKRRGEFALHIVFFLFANLAFWFLIPMPKTAALWLSGAWGLVLVSHLVKLLFDEAQERAVDREIERMRKRDAETAKPKRQHMEIGEDGELIEIADDAPQFRQNEHFARTK
jgi:hypothetical protein